ncbi:ABC transporter permease [Rarobacter faecitabidus]|uniref:ABC-2 type transport system permease protein n=1 Tax=Rarobacter faecitabidus TaxID=13243 RepID=A0A542ZVU5_RARFA|nr:ABC transporter permease [Rarobacter faecitabidus]TQL64451.1 ABC-2 type transport system permease protein [Rarobacter faecitabidus]
MTAHAPLRSSTAIRLVAAREIGAQLRSKSFIISTVVMLVLILAAIVGSALLGGGDSRAPVAAIPQTEAYVADNPALEVTVYEDENAARAAVLAGDEDAAILPSSDSAQDPFGFYLVAAQDAPIDAIDALSAAPRVELLEPPTTSEGLRYLVSFAFGIVFMVAALTFGSMIAQNTVVEKQTRTVEILLSAVPARSLLGGKILGNSALAVGQTALIVGTAMIGLVVTGQADILQVLSVSMLWFVAFFVVGFVMLAAVYAGSASLVSRIEDTGSVLTPVTWLAMAPYFVVVFFSTNETVMAIASYVPFSAPVAMPVRVFMGTAAWWEPLISLAVLAGSAWVGIALAAAVYSRTVLRTGARVKLKDALTAEK